MRLDWAFRIGRIRKTAGLRRDRGADATPLRERVEPTIWHQNATHSISGSHVIAAKPAMIKTQTLSGNRSFASRVIEHLAIALDPVGGSDEHFLSLV